MNLENIVSSRTTLSNSTYSLLQTFRTNNIILLFAPLEFFVLNYTFSLINLYIFYLMYILIAKLPV